MSKGGSTSTSVEIPEYIEQAAKFNLRQAGALGQPGIAQMQNVLGRFGDIVLNKLPIESKSL